MIQKTFKLLIPTGTDVRSYGDWQQILIDLLKQIHVDTPVVDDNIMLHIGVTIGIAQTVKPELL